MPQRTRKFSQESVQAWSVAEVKMWLVSVKLEDCSDHFRVNGINGVRLLQLTSEDIAMMPVCQNNEKKKKQLKKALGSLPGNSVSKKAEKKAKMKSKQKSGSKSGEKKPPRGELPAPPGGSSLPPAPSLRPPPIPGGHPMAGLGVPDDTYQEPTESFGMPPPVRPPIPSGMFHPGMETEFDQEVGMDLEPRDTEGIYDAVDDMELPISGSIPLPQEHGNGYPMPRPPPDAPPPDAPPPDAPPPKSIQHPASYSQDYDDDDDQEIYEEGADLSEDDSFESEPSDEYESPFEDDAQTKHNQGNQAESIDQLADPKFRALRGKFYAHGLKDHSGFLSSSSGASVVSPPPPSGPPDPDQQEMDGPDDIYDIVSETGEEGIFEDIYDVPEEELKAMREESQRATVGATGKPPAALPPASPPPELDNESDDVYDIPAETMDGMGGVGKPPAPPPPIDEDIYDMDNEEPSPPPSPLSPPAQPPRPPKSSPMVNHKASPQPFHAPMMKPPIAASKLPPAPPPDSPPATLQGESLPPRPPKPVAEKAPPPPPVMDDLDLPPTSKPPPPPSTFMRPMMRAPIAAGPPPPRPPASTKTGAPSTFTLEGNDAGPPPPRPPFGSKPGHGKSEPQDMSLEQKLSRLQPSRAPAEVPPPPPVSGIGQKNSGSPKSPALAAKFPSTGSSIPSNVPPRDSPSSSPFLGGKFPQLRHVEKKQEAKKPSPSPELERKFIKPSEMKRTQVSPFGSQSSNVSNGPTVNKSPAPAPPASDSKPSVQSNRPPAMAKPQPAPKNARISDLMKRFEKSPAPESSSPSEGPSPVPSPTHKSSNLGPPKRVDPDISPLSGRKFNKKESLGDLRKKFEDGLSDRSTSPSSRESSRATSPDGGRPTLPHKPGGGSHHGYGSGGAPAPPWVKNTIPLEKTPPPSKQFGRAPSPDHNRPPKPAVAVTEPPSVHRPLPPRKREPPMPSMVEQQPHPKSSPKVSRRFPPPTTPAPQRPSVESEKIEEEDMLDPKQAFVYKPYKAPVKQKPPSPKPPTPEIEEEPEPPPVHRPPHLPPLQRPPISDANAPPLPSRPPPSLPPHPSSGDSGRQPELPSRPPPQHRPPYSPPPPDIPSLPPRPAKQAPPGPPAVDNAPPLPSRPWHSQAPPSAPPPSSEEPLPPSRPPKVFSAGSPSGRTWYHYTLDRKQAENKLKKYAKDGTFIVRDSTKIKGEYSLSLWFGGGVRHLRIRLRSDKKFVLGEEKSDELAFDSVVDLVSHHKREPLHLKSGGDTVLKYECSS